METASASSHSSPSSVPASHPASRRFFGSVNQLTCAALLWAQLTLLPNSAHADITALPVQSGADVVITYSGTVDLTGMTSVGPENISGYLNPTVVQYFSSDGTGVLYGFVPTPGTPFGIGGDSTPNSISGQTFGINFSASLVYVPSGYVSGDPLSGSMTFTGATLASLGLFESGTYSSTATPNFRFIVTFGPPPEQLSAFSTGLPMANAQGQMLINAGSTVTNDINNHLFYLRAGQGEEAADDSVAALMDEGVVVGQGDGGKGPIAQRVQRSRRWEVFTTVNYGNIKLSAVGSQAGVQIDAWAPSIGIERHLTRSLALGFATSFLTSDQRYTGSIGSLHLEGPALSAYLSFVRKNYWSSLLYSFGTYELDSTRNPGFGFPTAMGTTRTYTNALQYNTGWSFRFQNNTFVTGPFAGIDYLHGSVDAYSETGGGLAALRYGKQSYESLVSRVGWTASKKVQTNWAAITSQVRLSYERQNLKNNGTSVALINAPFSTSGGNQSPGQDYMVAGAGVNFQFTDRLNLLLFYQGQFFRNNQEAHFGSVRFGYSF